MQITLNININKFTSLIIILSILLSMVIMPVLGVGVNKDKDYKDDNQVISTIDSVPSTSIFTGCLSTISRFGLPKGVLYLVRVGTTPAGTCSSGDIRTSYVNASYVNSLESRIVKLEKLLAGVTRSGNDIYFNSANVHIRSGSGKTDGPVNGLGNLIIGYNEVRGPGDKRTGSHNLVIGFKNNYNSYGGLVAGAYNYISAPYASVSGGVSNTASGSYSSVSGGSDNKANYYYSSISGGVLNIASGSYSSVGGGYGNAASGSYSSVGGGYGNTAEAYYSSISGGVSNIASGSYSSVSGGGGNTAIGDYSSVSGGGGNAAIGEYSSVSGGSRNIGNDSYSTVTGGGFNTAYGESSSISGGYNLQTALAYSWKGGSLSG